MGRLHIVPNGSERWAVRQERDGGIVGEYTSAEEAEAAARDGIALGGEVEVIVHNRFGRTRRGDGGGSAA